MSQLVKLPVPTPARPESDSSSSEESEEEEVVEEKKKCTYVIDPEASVLSILNQKKKRLENFKPKPFDYSKIQLDSTIALYGKRRTGKTFMTKWLWYQDQIRTQIPVFFVISPTAKINKSWEDIIPSEYIFDNFDSYFLQRIMDRQKLYLTNPVMAHRNPWIGIMLDDAVADSGVKYSETLLKLFIAGRHYKIHLAVTTQEYWDVSRLKKEKTIRQEKIAQQDRHKMKQLDRRNFTLLDNWED